MLLDFNRSITEKLFINNSKLTTKLTFRFLAFLEFLAFWKRARQLKIKRIKFYILFIKLAFFFFYPFSEYGKIKTLGYLIFFDNFRCLYIFSKDRDWTEIVYGIWNYFLNVFYLAILTLFTFNIQVDYLLSKK